MLIFHPTLPILFVKTLGLGIGPKSQRFENINISGAHRRQKALLGEMPLNLPSNCLLDGLFTSGLRFLSSNPPGLSGRVATIRYEMLHLTEEGHRIDPPVDPAPEFLVPTHLHQLFCWVHNLQPLDLMGKPWINYHLEMQLLQVINKRNKGAKGNKGA